MENISTNTVTWPAWQRVVFRFFFIFLLFLANPITFLSILPGMERPVAWIMELEAKLALFFNKLVFHIPPASKPPNGNGDYPEQWMTICMYLLLAITGTLIWTVLDRKRKQYQWLNYGLCICIRYFLIINGISYGIIKMFGLQMPFPNLSQLATPLGDYLPMRFSWMFIGYSHTYQFFSGAIEVLAAGLLLFRRTATLGVLVSTGVFLNVMMLNLSYDIPVKINSIALVVLCLYLLAMETPRLYHFFFNNQARASFIFRFPVQVKWQRIAITSFKWLAIGFFIYTNFKDCIGIKKMRAQAAVPLQIEAGIYDVVLQKQKGDTITAAMPDSVYWQNIVFDRGGEGSIKTTDSRFRYRYGRSYFSYSIDTATHTVNLMKGREGPPVLIFAYRKTGNSLLQLETTQGNDSLVLLLRKRQKPFQLTEKQFHWVSETNR